MRSCLQIITLSILLFGFSAGAQEYRLYYELINSAEEKFLIQKDSACFADYDAAFQQFEPFLKDPYIAAQMALYLGDTARFYNYLQLCFENGMPIAAIHASPMVGRAYDLEISAEVAKVYKQSFSKRKYSEETIDAICMMCYQSDSIKLVMGADSALNQLFHQRENQARTYLLDNFLKKGMFPNERLIGISNDQDLEDFYRKTNLPDVYVAVAGVKGYHKEELELRRKCPYNLVLHSKCFYQDHKPLFIQAMMNGYLHPKELGILEETSMIWHKKDGNPESKCGPPEIRIAYNIFHNDPRYPTIQTFTTSKEDLLAVEANRKEIFMQKYSVDLLKKEMEKTDGFKFFFDFKDR